MGDGGKKTGGPRALLICAIAHHAGVLQSLGAVEPARGRPIRDALRRIYASRVEGDPPIEVLLEETRESDEEGAGRQRRS